MDILNFKITGTSPMLMHSDRMANPLDPVTIEHKLISGKRKKTEQDHRDMAKSEWIAGMYFDPEIGPFIPGQNIDAVIVAGAKLQRLGTKAKGGLMVLEDRIRVEYDGPRDIEALWADKSFVDCRSVKVQTARVMRNRPKFDNWSLTFSVSINGEMINKGDAVKALTDGGNLIGLGDFRPRFGRFSTVLL